MLVENKLNKIKKINSNVSNKKEITVWEQENLTQIQNHDAKIPKYYLFVRCPQLKLQNLVAPYLIKSFPLI